MLADIDVVYLNITYDCQYRCIFCVANVPSLLERPSMKFSELMKLASRANKESVFVISGGEPTLHDSLLPFIHALSSRGATTILQTNGYKLADKFYCQKLIESGVSEVGIPFYHFIGNFHDGITKKNGSFCQSIDALQNLIEMRRRLNSNVVVEAKLLISKITNNQNAKIVDHLLSLPYHPDKFLIKFLVSSIETEKNKDLVELLFQEAASSISDTIVKLSSTKLPFWIAGLPLCVLSDKIRNLYIQNNRMNTNNNPTLVSYNDPSVRGLKDNFQNVSSLCPYSKNCAINQHCSGPEETFLEKYKEISFSELGIHPISF